MSNDYDFNPQVTPNVMGYMNPLMAATMQVPPSPTMAGPNAGAAMGPSPAEIAASRLANMGGGGGYRMGYTPEQQQDYQQNVATGIPAAAASMAFPGLSAIGQAIAPSAIAADDPFAAIKGDPALYQSWTSRFHSVRGDKDQRNAQRQQILGDFSKFMGDRSNAANSAQATAAALADWRTRNADAINGLNPNDKSLVDAATTLEGAGKALTTGVDNKRKATETLAEQYPITVGLGEGLGMLASSYFPGLSAARKAGNLARDVSEAQTAFGNAYTKGGRVSQARLNAADAARNNLQAAMDNSSGIMGRFENPKMLGLGMALPYIGGTFAPNMYDVVMGSLSSDPNAQVKSQRAWSQIGNPENIGRAALEGALLPVAGTYIGANTKDFEGARTRGEGLLNSYQQQQDKELAKAAASAQRKTQRAKLKVVPND